MTSTAIQTDPLIAFVLSSIPESAGIARCQVRAALEYHGLGHFADNAEIITSELVTNAVQHAGMDRTETIAVTLMRVRSPDAVAVVVEDSSPHPPVRRETTAGSECGRGLQLVEALSVHWGWHPDDAGKEVFAVLGEGGTTVMTGISDVPMLHDIDADYTPQYVKLARALRDKIESGEHKRGDSLSAADVAHEYGVSVRVTCNALAMLAANRYVDLPGDFKPYRVIWSPTTTN